MVGKVRLSVLMVEDNNDHVELSREFLPDDAYEIAVAKNGSECLTAIKRRPFDVVLLDYSLPDTNGMDLLPRIREFQPNSLVLFVSAMDDPDLSYKALRAGASDYVVKGFGYYRKLHERIREAFEE